VLTAEPILTFDGGKLARAEVYFGWNLP